MYVVSVHGQLMRSSDIYQRGPSASVWQIQINVLINVEFIS